MKPVPPSLPALPALLALACLSSPVATAGESYDNCSGFIDSVPATVTTQGVWCLRADLSTAISVGAAITVATNNVTIDCNRFKLGGLAAGAGSSASGIQSTRLNTAVRNCNIRGFRAGVSLASDGGTDIIGSAVTNVFTSPASAQPYGTYSVDNGTAIIRDNRVRGIVSESGGSALGIFNLNNGRIVIRANDVQGTGAADSVGIYCQSSQGTAFRNVVAGQENAIAICAQSGNYVNNN